jgi:DNA-binding MarR family transcriptional regulator
MFGSKSKFEVGSFLARAHAKGQLDQFPISAISSQCGLSRPTVHQVLSEFESLGLIEYRVNASDSRFKHIQLTDKFFSAAQQQLQPFLNHIQDTVS